MSALLRTVEAGPPGQVSGSVLWLHGLGADGHDFEPLVPLLDLPHVRFVFPHAPAIPVTINGGIRMPAWYDLAALGETEQRSADEAGIHASAASIEALLEREVERGVPSHRIVLAGFSQGGAMALYVGTRYPRALLGIMVLSAYELLPSEAVPEGGPNSRTPALFCHGAYDPMVPVAAGQEAYRASARGGRRAEWHEFSMGHQVVPDEILVIREWLHGLFQEDTR
jgi:phospholipase/carboxylesterase